MRAFLASQRNARSTYATLSVAERDELFHVDRSSIVGEGARDLERARAALDRWAQYPEAWTRVISEHAPPRLGDVTCARLRHLGFWSLVACRVTRRDDAERGCALEIETLEGHAEVGVETFSLALDAEARVVYRIASRSGPAHVLTRLGEPVMRHYQARFLRESADALRAAMAR